MFEPRQPVAFCDQFVQLPERQLEHEAGGESPSVASYLFLQASCRDAIERGEVSVEHDLLAADLEDGILDVLDWNQVSTTGRGVAHRQSIGATRVTSRAGLGTGTSDCRFSIGGLTIAPGFFSLPFLVAVFVGAHPWLTAAGLGTQSGAGGTRSDTEGPVSVMSPSWRGGGCVSRVLFPEA